MHLGEPLLRDSQVEIMQLSCGPRGGHFNILTTVS